MSSRASESGQKTVSWSAELSPPEEVVAKAQEDMDEAGENPENTERLKNRVLDYLEDIRLEV